MEDGGLEVRRFDVARNVNAKVTYLSENFPNFYVGESGGFYS